MDFSHQLGDRSSFPDEVIAHFMRAAGVETDVPHVLRIVGMAAQKFVSDVGTAALNCHAETNSLSLDDPEAQFTLHLEDLHAALDEYDDALQVPKKPDYFV